jgi:hypothetical protein
MEYLNLKKEDAPQVLLISMGNENNNKYKPDTSSITSAVVSQFVEDFFANKLNAHLFSSNSALNYYIIILINISKNKIYICVL